MSSPTSYLAFDLGASTCRAVLGTLAGDRMRLDVVHRFATPVIERAGQVCWDIAGMWDELGTGLREARRASPQLRSLSVDSWAVDYVPLAADGTPLRLPRCYRDPRTNGMMERAFETMPAEAIYAHTGIQFLQFNTLYQLLADRAEDAEAVEQVHSYLPIADYFNYRFSGAAAVELSMASTTQLLDVRSQCWAAPVFEAFGLAASRWPAIVPSGTRLGHVQSASDVAVIASCSHDTGAAVAAAPAAAGSGQWAFISSGSWSLLGVERTTPLLTVAARDAGFTNEAGVDGTIRFLKNLTGLWALQECLREWGGADWGELEREAREASAGGAIIDLEDARFLPHGGMPMRLRGWCRERGQPVPETRARLVRAILESIAHSYARALADLERVTGERFAVLHVFGGGSQNRLLCELAADACGIDLVAGPAEATALGNLLLQARTLGDLPPGLTIRDVAARSCELTTFHPTTSSRMEPYASNR